MQGLPTPHLKKQKSRSHCNVAINFDIPVNQTCTSFGHHTQEAIGIAGVYTMLGLRRYLKFTPEGKSLAIYLPYAGAETIFPDQPCT